LLPEINENAVQLSPVYHVKNDRENGKYAESEGNQRPLDGFVG
jgi:hypothetical protein